jgi:AraC-like DNA-binding protein
MTPTAPPARVGRGAVVFAPTGAEHGLSDRPQPLAILPVHPTTPRPSVTGEFAWLSGCYHVADRQLHTVLRDMAPIIVLPGDDRITTMAALLADDISSVHPGGDASMVALIDLLLLRLLRQTEDFGDGSPYRTVSDPVIAGAVQAVHDDPRAPWSLARLSALAGLSRTVFTSRFVASVGTSPMAYVTDLRLSRGARILRETDAPLAAVARQVGYASEFSFASAFRREFGVAPGRYRRSATS